jgi:hypothetical protein
MLPNIPVINFVLKHQSKPFNEEFETYRELMDYVLSDIPEVSESIIKEWLDNPNTKAHSDDQMFIDYAGDHIEDFLGENGYILTRIVKG